MASARSSTLRLTLTQSGLRCKCWPALPARWLASALRFRCSFRSLSRLLVCDGARGPPAQHLPRALLPRRRWQCISITAATARASNVALRSACRAHTQHAFATVFARGIRTGDA
eukprot:13962868-Alexandrium_andersonii.AAC.1